MAGWHSNHIGDSMLRRQGTGNLYPRAYTGIPPKNLLLVPQRFALAAQADGWIVRSLITWVKKAPMPESAKDRPTSATEAIWLLAKRGTYYWDGEAVKAPYARVWNERNGGSMATPNEDAARAGMAHQGNAHRGPYPMPGTGANMRNYLLLGPSPSSEPHYAQFHPAIPEMAIKAGTSEHGCCARCGAQQVRVVERESRQHQAYWVGSNRGNGVASGGGHVGRTGEWSADTRTVGWQPSCTHTDARVKPAHVLDIFGGSGTTGAVAEKMGRDWTLIELSEAYVKIAERRTAQRGLFQFHVEVARHD